MKVPCTYTLNELQRITPNLRKEHFFSECPKVKKALRDLFWNLGCTLPDKPDIVEGVVTRNRFDCIDDSIRINVFEREDENWVKTRFASHQVRVATNDVSLLRDIDSLTNQRSFDVGAGIEAV